MTRAGGSPGQRRADAASIGSETMSARACWPAMFGVDPVTGVVGRVEVARPHRVLEYLVEGEDPVAGAAAAVPLRDERADGVPVPVAGWSV